MKTPPWLLAAPLTLETGRIVVLDPTEARHLTGSLRRRVGDAVVLADGQGSVAEARVAAVARDRVEVEVLSVQLEPKPDCAGVTLALALIESQAMDWAVQKAVEVGVRRLLPMATERTQRRAKDLGNRIEHWRRIALQALKQCHRPWAMAIAEIQTLASLVETEPESGVVADREGCAIVELDRTIGNLLVVGPEGGFSATEIELFERHGWPRIRLGPHVLRADTAAVIGGAMMVARSERLSVESKG